jgi:hypothetical protein
MIWKWRSSWLQRLQSCSRQGSILALRAVANNAARTVGATTAACVAHQSLLCNIFMIGVLCLKVTLSIGFNTQYA